MHIDDVSVINLNRCLEWHPDGLNSWSLSDWGVAWCGEFGEAMNIVKKLNRIRDGLVGNRGESEEELKAALADEIADIYLYLDLFAQAAGVDLTRAIRAKFNQTSKRLKMPHRL